MTSSTEDMGTEYTYEKGAYKGSNDLCWWWLRSSGYYQNTIELVLTDGSVYSIGTSVDGGGKGAVRPAMWVDINA